jgi:hypothetical protein
MDFGFRWGENRKSLTQPPKAGEAKPESEGTQRTTTTLDGSLTHTAPVALFPPESLDRQRLAHFNSHFAFFRMSARKRKYTSDRHQTTEAEAEILWEYNAMYWRISADELRLPLGHSVLAKVQREIERARTVKLKDVAKSVWKIDKVREWFNRHSPKALARPGRHSGPVGEAAHTSRLAQDPEPLIAGDQSSATRVEAARPGR